MTEKIRLFDAVKKAARDEFEKYNAVSLIVKEMRLQIAASRSEQELAENGVKSVKAVNALAEAKVITDADAISYVDTILKFSKERLEVIRHGKSEVSGDRAVCDGPVLALQMS